mgnify:CR=1 FL=1
MKAAWYVILLVLISILAWTFFPAQETTLTVPARAPTPALASAPTAAVELPKAPASAPHSTSKHTLAQATSDLRNMLAEASPDPYMPDQEYVQANLAAFKSQDQLRMQIKNLVSSLLAQDLQGTIAWAHNLPDDIPVNTRREIWTDALQDWAKSDPAAAAQYTVSLASPNGETNSDPGIDARNDTRLVAGVWAQTDSKAALGWAESLPAGQLQKDAFNSVLNTIAKTDGQGAWNVATQQYETDHNSFNLVSVVGMWSSSDPAAAARAVASMPEGTDDALLAGVSGMLISNWMDRDPTAVAQWIDGLPPGVLKNDAEASQSRSQQAMGLGKTTDGK